MNRRLSARSIKRSPLAGNCVLRLWLTVLLTWVPSLPAEGFLCAGSVSLSAATPAAKPVHIAQSLTTGTRQALVLLARFKGDPLTRCPPGVGTALP